MKVLTIYVDAGLSSFESPAAEYAELPLSLDSLLFPNPDSSYVAVANGISMTGAGILDGNFLVVDRSLTPKNGDICICNLNGTFVCKILDITNASLHSASPDHPTVRISEADTFQLEGIVTSTFRVFKGQERVKSCLP